MDAMMAERKAVTWGLRKAWMKAAKMAGKTAARSAAWTALQSVENLVGTKAV
jgi:hypothetical protein